MAAIVDESQYEMRYNCDYYKEENSIFHIYIIGWNSEKLSLKR